MSNLEKTNAILDLFESLAETNKDDVVELTIESFKQTKAYNIAQSISDYVIVSQRGAHLVKEINKLDFERAKSNELHQLYNSLQRLTDEFMRLVHSSHQAIDQGSYNVDIVSKLKLNRTEPRLRKLIQVVADSRGAEPAHAFRNYLKKSSDPTVHNEYLRIRPANLQQKDEQYNEIRQLVAAWIGFILFAVIAYFVIPYMETVEYLLLSAIGIVVLMSLIRVFHPIIRYFSVNIVFLYIVGIVIVTVLQIGSESFMNIETVKLRQLHYAFLMGLIGFILATFISNFTNGLHKVSNIQPPHLLRIIDRKLIMVTIFLALYTGVWYNSFSDQKTIYASLLTYLQERETAKQQKQEDEPLGTLVVTVTSANVRTEPKIVDDNIFYQLKQGFEIHYYDTHNDENGDTWYKLISKDNKPYWIHGGTVEVIE